MIAGKRSMRLKLGRVSGCIRHRFRRGFTDLNTKTRPQKVLGSRDRIRNLKGAFGVTKSWIPKKCVLVIDDIYTTGNTIHRVAKVLKNAGVQKVYFLTISIGQGL